jgi:phospholipid/cholesterol/gamma-HCH transport system substrate-binding protein
VKKLITPFRVGLLVITAGAFLFTFLTFVRKGGLGEDDSTTVFAYFRDASGIGPKSRVQIAGIPVGEVTDIVLQGTRAKVTLRIRDEVDLREDAALTKRSESLLGDYLLDLNPGTEAAPRMPEGGQIRRVIDTQGMEAVFESLSQITADIQQVTRALRDTLGGDKGQGSLERIVENMVQLSETVDVSSRASAERIEAILRNFERVSADVAGLTQGNTDELNRIVTNIDVITRDTREVLGTVKRIIGSGGEGDLKEGVASLKQTLGRLDQTLANLEAISGTVREGKGTVGALLADEGLGQKLTETVRDVSDYANRLTSLQTEVGIRSEYLLTQGRSKNTLSLRVIPKPDKYYLLELVDDPRGKVETEIVQENPPSAGDPVVQTRTVTRETFKLSAQFAKRYYFATLRFGIIESTGGVGADLHFLKETLHLKMDAFNFSVSELRYPRVRASLRAQAFDHLYVTAGVDDLLNRQERDLNTQRLIAGRDFFFGGGLFFTDDDLKALLPSLPTP